MTSPKNTGMGRRSFLKAVAATGAATSFSLWPNFSPLAHAQSHHPDGPDRYYIFCYFPGGWDVLLSLIHVTRRSLQMVIYGPRKFSPATNSCKTPTDDSSKPVA